MFCNGGITHPRAMKHKRQYNGIDSQSPAAALPPRLVVQCASFLGDAAHLTRISRVCRAWRAIPPDICEPLWRTMMQRDYPDASAPQSATQLWATTYKLERCTQNNWRHGRFQLREVKYEHAIVRDVASTDRHLAMITTSEPNGAGRVLVWNIEGVPRMVHDCGLRDVVLHGLQMERVSITDRWLYIALAHSAVHQWPLLLPGQNKRVLDTTNDTCVARCTCDATKRGILSLASHDDMVHVGWHCSNLMLHLPNDHQHATRQCSPEQDSHVAWGVDWKRNVAFGQFTTWFYDDRGWRLKVVAMDHATSHFAKERILWETRESDYPKLTYDALANCIWVILRDRIAKIQLGTEGHVVQTLDTKLSPDEDVTERLVQVHAGVVLQWVRTFGRMNEECRILRLDTGVETCRLLAPWPPRDRNTFSLITRSKLFITSHCKMVVLDFGAV